MSHYIVAVVNKPGQSIEELLAPYDENMPVAPYLSRTKEEIIKDAKDRLNKYLQEYDSFKLAEMEEKYPDLFAAKTDEEFYKAECAYWDYDLFDDEGNLLTTYNPKSKWDWWVAGGRWANALPVKPGCSYTAQETACVKDINFGVDEAKYAKYKRFYEVAVDGAPLAPGENPDDFQAVWPPASFLKERYKSADLYARINSTFTCFAVVTSDGEWYEKGQMGWWGISTETHEESNTWDLNFEEFLKAHSEPDDWVTIVDCHI